MGGTDDPSNLVELTVEEHAEAHRLLWEQHGNKKDFVAWKALSTAIGKEEVRRQLSILGGSISGAKNLANMSEESKLKRIQSRKSRPGGYNPPELMKMMSERSKSPEAKQKQKQRYIEIGHMQGSKNSQYGTMWITNGVENKKIKKEDLDKWISLGYNKGRIMRD